MIWTALSYKCKQHPLTPSLVYAMKRVSLIKGYKTDVTNNGLKYSSDQDMTILVKAVAESDANMVVFVGNSHNKLIQLLDTETTVFRFPKVTITVLLEDKGNDNLQKQPLLKEKSIVICCSTIV